MANSMSRRVHEAVVLAAGNGDRFADGSNDSKLLRPVLGKPLILRTLESVARAGISLAHLVLGYQASKIRAAVERSHPDGLTIQFHWNPDWPGENGLSALVPRPDLNGRPFALVMGDHLFHWQLLRLLLDEPTGAGECLLGIDRRPVATGRAAEATKVRTRRGRVTAIGKELHVYDAVDTGIFVFPPSIFAALDESCSRGDTTLSGGVRRLVAQGVVRGIEIGDRAWCDIDTPADLATAELIASEHAVFQ